MSEPVRRAPDIDIPNIGRPGRGGGGGGMNRFTPKEKPKDAKGTFIKLLKFYAREKKSLAIACCILVVNSLLGALSPYFIGKAIDAMPAVGNVVFTTVYKFVLILHTLLK